MVGGPNGSGKSTVLSWLAGHARSERFPLGFVLNPDSVEREIAYTGRLYLEPWGVAADGDAFDTFVRAHSLFPRIDGVLPVVDGNVMLFDKKRATGYLIPVLCDFFRQQWMEAGESFTFETVMSGPDKLDILRRCRRNRYRTYLYYVCTDNVAINRGRIENRVLRGGHSVPVDRIEKRYEGSLEQLMPAIRLVDRAYLFDNSGKNHQLVATFSSGHLEEIRGGARPPQWLSDHVLSRYRPPAQKP